MSKIIRWGILGCGKIANSFAKDLALLEEAHLQAVASRSLEKAQTFATAHQAKMAHGSYEALFNDAEVDIIYIATPHDSHAHWGIAAMNAGKAVLCEKPLAVNQQQVQSMVDAARQNQVFLMEAFWSRFNPSIRAVLDLVEQGAIGKVSHIEANFCFCRPNAPVESRLFNLELAGGSLLDVGVYPTFLSYAILGKPKQILATANLHATGADLQTAAIFKYDNAIGQMMCGFASDSDMVAKIHGTDGKIHIHHRWHETQGYSIIKGNEKRVISLPTLGKGFTYEIQECIQCLQNGELESKRWSHQNSLDMMQITDEIRTQIGVKYPFE